MKNIRLLLSALLFLSFFCLCANDGYYTSSAQGGTLYPMQNQSVQMLEEEVVYNQKAGTFSTRFIFYNTSDQTEEVILGFPVMPSEDEEAYYDEDAPEKTKAEIMTEIEAELQFKTWINGKEIARQLWQTDTVDNYEYAFYTPLTFKSGEKIEVLNKFKQGFGYGGTNLGENWTDISYILKTGASWKGNIQNATVRFELEPTDLNYYTDTIIAKRYGIMPTDGYCYTVEINGWNFSPEPTTIDHENSIITWELRDFKPDFDIHIRQSKSCVEMQECFDFVDDFDILALYITNNEKDKFEKYIEKLRKKKYLFKNQKENCAKMYIQYAEDIIARVDTVNNQTLLKSKIRHIVNGLAAIRGYIFKNEQWASMFGLFTWYEPVTGKPHYTAAELEIIDQLLLFEKGEQLSQQKNEAANIASDPQTPAQMHTAVSSADDNNDAGSRSSFIVILSLCIIMIAFFVVVSVKRRK